LHLVPPAVEEAAVVGLRSPVLRHRAQPIENSSRAGTQIVDSKAQQHSPVQTGIASMSRQQWQAAAATNCAGRVMAAGLHSAALGAVSH
jgi:hypothetical protein